MSEVLSQNEIDDLLKALSSGELDVEEYTAPKEKQIKDYDFSRPSKFSREHLRTLEIIFENYGRLLYTNLPAYLRKTVQVEVMSSEAVIYSEFANALSNPVLLGVIDFAPLQGNIIMEIAPSLGYAIIDRMLGGSGQTLDKQRDFSEIEVMILENVVSICVDLLIEPWQNVVEVAPRLERIETNSQFAQIVSPSEMIAIITISMTIGDVEGLIHVCIPFMTIEPVIDKLNTKYWYANMQAKSEAEYDDQIEILISKVKVPVKAVLGNSTISVGDFANLQKGDIIKLDSGIEEELTVYVGNISKFKALPGSADDNYAVRVTSIIREEQ